MKKIILISSLALSLLVLTVRVRANLEYDSWQAVHFTSTQITNGLADAMNDFDHDGLVNLVEYAFDLDPLVSGNTDNLPKISTSVSNNFLHYTRKNTLTHNHMSFELSDDLFGWNPVNWADYTEQVMSSNSVDKTQQVQVSFTGLTNAVSFIRANVHLEPNVRPNIIMLFADDQRADTFGGTGHPWIQTPNVNQLIHDGVRFDNAYSAEPTCSPSRVALFTGMHERVNGVGFSSRYSADEDMWDASYPALLRADGYHTGFIGKFGVQYYTFLGNAAPKFDYWRAHDGWAKFFAGDTSVGDIYSDSVSPVITEIMGESMIEFLDQAPTNKPFCLSVSFSAPHGSVVGSMDQKRNYQTPANQNSKIINLNNPIYLDLYRDKPLSVISPDTATDPYAYIPQSIMDQDVYHGRKWQYFSNYTTPYNWEHHIRYHQLITGIDKVIGDLVAELAAKGLDQNTVIIYSSDNGLLLGEYGMGGKGLLYDLTCKVPCLVYDPRQPAQARGIVRDELVSTLDITSTILDYAEIPQPPEMYGQSLMPFIAGQTNAPQRDYLFIENMYTGRDTPLGEGIRKGKWKYIRMFKVIEGYLEADVDFSGRTPDFEQLFDLDADPAEKTNLISNPAHSTVLADLRTLCQQESDALNQRRTAYRNTHTISTENASHPK